MKSIVRIFKNLLTHNKIFYIMYGEINNNKEKEFIFKIKNY